MYQKLTGRTSGFIFRTSNDTQISARKLLRRYYSVLDKFVIPRIRLHDLRHTAATLLLKENVHRKTVQFMLGPANISQTLSTYTHVIPSVGVKTAEKWALCLSAAPYKQP